MKFKRFLSLAVSLAMVLAMVPAFSLTASAAEAPATFTAEFLEQLVTDATTVIDYAGNNGYSDSDLYSNWGWTPKYQYQLRANLRTYDGHDTLQIFNGENNAVWYVGRNIITSTEVQTATANKDYFVIDFLTHYSDSLPGNFTMTLYSGQPTDSNMYDAPSDSEFLKFQYGKDGILPGTATNQNADEFAESSITGGQGNYVPVRAYVAKNAQGTYDVIWTVKNSETNAYEIKSTVSGLAASRVQNGFQTLRCDFTFNNWKHVGFSDLKIYSGNYSEMGNMVGVTATYTVNGETVDTVTNKYNKTEAASASFDATYYYKDGENTIYYAEATELSKDTAIEMTVLANADIASYGKGKVVAINGTQYDVLSDNLIPNGDFSLGLTGWYSATGEEAKDFVLNGDGTVKSNAYAGTSSSGALYRTWDIEPGKTYVFTFETTTNTEFQKFTLVNSVSHSSDVENSGSKYETWNTGVNTYVFNSGTYEYARIQYRWCEGQSFGNFGLYEIAEATTVVTEEVDSYTIPVVKVIGDTAVVLPTTVEVTGTLGTKATGTIVWNDAPTTYPVGNTTVKGTMTVKFGEQEDTTANVSTTVTVLEETFTIADSASKNGRPGNVVYFPIEIADEFTIEFDMNIVRRTDVSVQMGYDGTMFSAAALGISPNGGVFRVTGGSKNGTAGISHDLFASVNNGDTIHVLLTMDASDGTYSLTARKADGEMATVSEQGFRQTQSAINTMTLVTNGDGTMGDTAANGDITVSNIKVNANVSKTEYTINITIGGGATETRTASYWTEAEALAAIADINGYEKKVSIDGTTINVVYSATQTLAATFIDANENVIKSVSEIVAIGETYTVNAEEIFYIDSNDAGHFYQIPETVLSADNNNVRIPVSEAANKYAVIYDAFVTDNELWGTTDADATNSIFVATSRDVDGAPGEDANGVSVTDGVHTPSGLGSSRVGFFQFPVVDLQEGQKVTAAFGVRSWHANTFSNGNTSIRYTVTAINDTTWTAGANGSTYNSANAPVLESWSTPVFSNVATQADTELTFDVTEIMAAAKAAGLSTITLRVNASWGAAYIADREEAVAGGMYEGQASYLLVEDANLVKVTAAGSAELTKNGSAMNGVAYVAATDDVRLNADGAIVVNTAKGYYKANTTLSFTEAAALGTTVPASLGLAMVNGAQVRVGSGVDEEGKVDELSASGLRFIATADYSDTVIADDENVEFGIKVTADGSSNVVYIPAEQFQGEYEGVFTAAITNLAVSNYNRPYTAAAYAKVTMADGTVEEFTTDSVTRSIYQVSAGIMRNGNANTDYDNAVDSAILAVLNAYVNQVGVRIENNGSTWAADDVYTGDVFFTVESVDNGDGTVTVTITPDSTWVNPVEIAEWWAEYVRANNNNKAFVNAIVESSLEDGVLTITFTAPANN